MAFGRQSGPALRSLSIYICATAATLALAAHSKAQPEGSPSPCSIACLQHAQETFESCVAAGGDLQECTTALQITLQACLETNCAPDTGTSVCSLECHALSAGLFKGCLEQGGMTEICAVDAQLFLRGCLEPECLRTPRESCETKCRQEALAGILQCIDSGHDWPACEVPGLNQLMACRAECVVCTGRCNSIIWPDDRRDAAARSTEQNPHSMISDTQALDLQSIELGRWAPHGRQELQIGGYSAEGQFLRIVLTIAGLANPPAEQPFLHGPHPLFGYVELDVDRDLDTGGELDADHFYLANAARLGGLVADIRLRERMAQTSWDLDKNFLTPPFVERSGEELHLAFTEWEGQVAEVREGDRDEFFEAGEVWWMEGEFLHRAHGFEPFSLSKGPGGSYLLPCHVEFRHDEALNVTTVALVVPLTQAGAAWLRGEPEEPADHSPFNQSSVFEALWGLQNSAAWLEIHPTGEPEEVLIHGWADRDPQALLDPTRWRLTALLGTSAQQDPQPVWTDVFPNVISGDVDGSGFRTPHDWERTKFFVQNFDSVDGTVDGAVILGSFAADFAVFDIDYNGVADQRDIFLTRGDADRDGDVDSGDQAWLQRCQGRSAAQESCRPLDLDGSGVVDRLDSQIFTWLKRGPD
jgi:hypothetical protein